MDKETMGMRQGEKPVGEEQASPAARTYNILQPSAAALGVQTAQKCIKQHTAKHNFFFIYFSFKAWFLIFILSFVIQFNFLFLIKQNM